MIDSSAVTTSTDYSLNTKFSNNHNISAKKQSNNRHIFGTTPKAQNNFLGNAKMLPTEKSQPRFYTTIGNDAMYFTPKHTQQLPNSRLDYSPPPMVSFARLPEPSTITTMVLTHGGAGLTLQPSGSSLERERVRVQHVPAPTKLRHNHWQTFSFAPSRQCSSSEIHNNSNSNCNDNQLNGGGTVCINRSAFTECASAQRCATAVTTIAVSGSQRTEDQENAFRRIEDVHNYAKLSDRYSHEGSSNSSVRDDDDDEEEEEEESDDDDDLRRLEIDVALPSPITNAIKSGATGSQSVAVLGRMAVGRMTTRVVAAEETEAHEDVDVETVVPQQQQWSQQHLTSVLGAGEGGSLTTPDHHARRPMNAFLIFCKRHRAIVKERYKTLENRAITKILGDWWASLDCGDKQCFTDLAQQNKDAFFSANPNFKWYKLPAPPLRTLATRPSNGHEPPQRDLDEMPSERPYGKFFKLADETQMGELSTLMRSAAAKSAKTHCALQQALCETTEYLTVHMPLQTPTPSAGHVAKRRLYSEQSFSSNSSEDIDTALPRKRSRSCKGKIYQELINSGQIAAILKKTKSAMRSPGGDEETSLRCMENSAIPMEQQQYQQQMPLSAGPDAEAGKRRVVSESSESSSLQSMELVNFDLEERIKELPALNLDSYLQRKRNTKRKKKFSVKSRYSNTNNQTSNTPSSPTVTASTPIKTGPVTVATPPAQQPQAVGSQKRKARKESITRRDISAIENEVATISGCYFLNEAATAAITATAGQSIPANCDGLSQGVEEDFNSRRCSSFNNGNTNNNNSSTSDLLILAELAAERTQLTN